MGDHIDAQGRFQSDKYPDLPPDKIVLSFHDPAARVALATFVQVTYDRELALTMRLDALETADGE